MINISLKLHYGLLSLIELSHYMDAKPLQLKDISSRHHIPPKYLEQVIAVLRQAGFIQSMRGVNGGYSLAQHPDDIAILDVARALQGASTLDPKLKGTALEGYWQELILGVDRLMTYTLSEFIVNCYASDRLTYSI